MKTNLMMVLTVVALLGADAPKADAVKAELKKFEGTWKLVSADLDGNEAKPEDVKAYSLVVVRDEFTLKFGTETHKGKFKIDPAKKPKAIDVDFTEGTLKGSKVLGVYEMEGDTRKSCFADPGADRPSDFTGGKGKYLWKWKREKPQEAKEDAIEIKMFEGTWIGVSVESEQEKAEYKGLKCIIAGDKVTVQVPVEGRLEKGLLRMKIDPTRKPKAIDLWVVQPGQTDEEAAKQNGALGIYDLECDTLTVCAGPFEKGRPTEFSAKDGTDRVVYVLKREKPKEVKADVIQQEIKKLQGAWAVESVTWDPREKNEGMGKGLSIIISGESLVAKVPGEDKNLGKANFKIDPTKELKTIDITGEGGNDVVRGIYKLEGDTLTVCVGPNERKERPTDFASKPGSRQTLVVLKRVDELQGVWIATAIEIHSKPASDDEIKATRFTFKGDKVLVRTLGHCGLEGEGTFKADREKSPKHLDMDLVKLTGIFPGIYEVEKDVLRICYGAGGKPDIRPTEFATSEKDEFVLIKFKRQKP
jgi:uncharacterized protein (TIGR03067 family)